MFATIGVLYAGQNEAPAPFHKAFLIERSIKTLFIP